MFSLSHVCHIGVYKGCLSLLFDDGSANDIQVYEEAIEGLKC